MEKIIHHEADVNIEGVNDCGTVFINCVVLGTLACVALNMLWKNTDREAKRPGSKLSHLPACAQIT